MASDITPAHHATPLELHFELTLRRDGPGRTWRAELAARPVGQRLQFESLVELMRHLTHLDPPAPPRGIR